MRPSLNSAPKHITRHGSEDRDSLAPGAVCARSWFCGPTEPRKEMECSSPDIHTPYSLMSYRLPTKLHCLPEAFPNYQYLLTACITCSAAFFSVPSQHVSSMRARTLSLLCPSWMPTPRGVAGP